MMPSFSVPWPIGLRIAGRDTIHTKTHTTSPVLTCVVVQQVPAAQACVDSAVPCVGQLRTGQEQKSKSENCLPVISTT
jgi:hypothetical protein